MITVKILTAVLASLMIGGSFAGAEVRTRSQKTRAFQTRDSRNSKTSKPKPVTQLRRPEVYVDRGACPFECCTYREWWAAKPTAVYASPSSGAARIKSLVKGEHVRAVTGFVRSRATEFAVTRKHGRYRPGDTIWVYSYRGEGFFLVWFNGKMFDEDLGFSPYGGSGGTRCQDDPGNCWGRLKAEHVSEWWIKLRLRDGRIGWTNHGSDYSNADACG